MDAASMFDPVTLAPAVRWDDPDTSRTAAERASVNAGTNRALALRAHAHADGGDAPHDGRAAGRRRAAHVGALDEAEGDQLAAALADAGLLDTGQLGQLMIREAAISVGVRGQRECPVGACADRGPLCCGAAGVGVVPADRRGERDGVEHRWRVHQAALSQARRQATHWRSTASSCLSCPPQAGHPANSGS
jgi:hypothetical protein